MRRTRVPVLRWITQCSQTMGTGSVYYIWTNPRSPTPLLSSHSTTLGSCRTFCRKTYTALMLGSSSTAMLTIASIRSRTWVWAATTSSSVRFLHTTFFQARDQVSGWDAYFPNSCNICVVVVQLSTSKVFIYNEIGREIAPLAGWVNLSSNTRLYWCWATCIDRRLVNCCLLCYFLRHCLCLSCHNCAICLARSNKKECAGSVWLKPVRQREREREREKIKFMIRSYQVHNWDPPDLQRSIDASRWPPTLKWFCC